MSGTCIGIGWILYQAKVRLDPQLSMYLYILGLYIHPHPRHPMSPRRRNIFLPRRGFFFAHMLKMLNNLSTSITVFYEKRIGIISTGYNNLGNTFIFKRATRPIQANRKRIPSFQFQKFDTVEKRSKILTGHPIEHGRYTYPQVCQT